MTLKDLFTNGINFLYGNNYYIYLILFEFIISLFILLFLILTVLKRNYVNIYCLFLLNFIVFIFFITIYFQESIMTAQFYNISYLRLLFNDLFDLTTFDLFIKNLNEYLRILILFSRKSYYLSFITVPFYNNNLIFNLFIEKIKIFTLILFLLTLLVGYNIRKILKISYDKILLILFPLYLSNLILIQTQDLIIAYLSIELQNLCLIFLMGLKKNNKFNIQLSIRFFILNSIGSLFILLGIVLLYSKLYTTNLSEIYYILNSLPIEYFKSYANNIILALFFLITGLFFKLGVGPFGLWLVEIYENSITFSVFIFSLIPKIGYFVFILHLYLATSQFNFLWDLFLKIFGLLSIIIGTFGALSQIYLKRLLAFSSLNYFGYILLSFIGFTEKGLILCVLYIFFYMLISIYIWYIIMYLERVIKRNIILLDLVVLRDHYPILSTILAFSFFFLSGLPPFYLFILKFSTFNILIDIKTNIFIILIFLICSFCSIIYYLKLVKIIHFNSLPNNSYKIYPINNFIIILIFLYTILLITPFVFILINYIYKLLYKILYKYIYTLYSQKPIFPNSSLIVIDKIFKRLKRKKCFNYYSIFSKSYRLYLIPDLYNFNILKNEMIREKAKLTIRFLKLFDSKSLKLNYDRKFFLAYKDVINKKYKIKLNILPHIKLLFLEDKDLKKFNNIFFLKKLQKNKAFISFSAFCDKPKIFQFIGPDLGFNEKGFEFRIDAIELFFYIKEHGIFGSIKNSFNFIYNIFKKKDK